MKYPKECGNRRSIRLKGYDYSQAGAYFVTICAHNRKCLFGEIVSGKTALNGYGAIIADSWQWLKQQYQYVDLDEWAVMPNHLHGIIMIRGRGGSRTAPTNRKPLGRLVGAFKTVSARRINEIRNTLGAAVWQRNYYEHIIRNDIELNRIREYIIHNPATWDTDNVNPDTAGNHHAQPFGRDYRDTR